MRRCWASQAAPERLGFLAGLEHLVKRLPAREAAAAAAHLQVRAAFCALRHNDISKQVAPKRLGGLLRGASHLLYTQGTKSSSRLLLATSG